MIQSPFKVARQTQHFSIGVLGAGLSRLELNIALHGGNCFLELAAEGVRVAKFVKNGRIIRVLGYRVLEQHLSMFVSLLLNQPAPSEKSQSTILGIHRSEERRVGKEGRTRCATV